MKAIAGGLLFGMGIALLYLFLSVPLGFLRDGYRSGAMLPCLRGRRLRPHRRLYRFCRAPTDLLFVVFAALALSVYDCAYLGGGMRLTMLFPVFIGAAAVAFLWKSSLLRALRISSTIPLDLLLWAIALLLMPLRLMISQFARLIQKILLIYKEKHAKIKERRLSRVYRRILLARSETAFLPRELRLEEIPRDSRG